MAVYRLPLNEVVFDFYDRLKSVSAAATPVSITPWMGYEERRIWCAFPFMVNGDPVDALSFIAHRSGRRTAAAARSAPS